MKIGLAQINPIVGDLPGNTEKIAESAQKARKQGAELVVFPELCLVGYPPMDLLDKGEFVRATGHALENVAAKVPPDVGVLLGAPVENRSAVGKRLFNSAVLLEGGKVVAEVHKRLLPTYDVFDEYRYFEPADRRPPVVWRGLRLGIHICEDMWNDEDEVPYHLYSANPVDQLAEERIDLFINLSASPFSTGKAAARSRLISDISREHGVPFVLVNQVGANTELVFDGRSGVWDARGRPLLSAAAFESDLVVWDMDGMSGGEQAEVDDV